jgi:hypothetical protein
VWRRNRRRPPTNDQTTLNPVTFRPDLTVAAARVAFADPAGQKDLVVHLS